MYKRQYLSTVCKKVSGKTAFEWINDYVVEDIKYFLKEEVDYFFKQIFTLGISAEELSLSLIHISYSSHQQRLRRVIEDNLFLRNILLMLSNQDRKSVV